MPAEATSALSFLLNVPKIKKLIIRKYVLLIQIKCLKWPPLAQMQGDVCVTHLLRRWSRFAPSHARQHNLLQFTNVVNFRPIEPLLHFSPNFVVNRVKMWTVRATCPVKLTWLSSVLEGCIVSRTRRTEN